MTKTTHSSSPSSTPVVRTSKMDESQKANAFNRESTREDSIAKYEKTDEFEPRKHFYPRVLNSSIHPFVSYFFNLNNNQIVSRYCHLNPKANKKALLEALNYKPKFLRWAGSDLFYCTDDEGHRDMLVVETNSCPSGQKSMPNLSDDDEYGSYKKLIETTFKPLVEEEEKKPGFIKDGCLAVIYDKNVMEASGYAAAMSAVFEERVYLVEYRDETIFSNKETNSEEKEKLRRVFWTEDGICSIRTKEKDEHGNFILLQVRALFRYVTQKPWNRIPIKSRTVVLNPTIVCLAGGRNKNLASLAYEMYNNEVEQYGFNIPLPQTFRDVKKKDIPKFCDWLGGKAVVKVPYSNAGQGVYTVTSPKELQAVMDTEHSYDQFIVQQLIGNFEWSSETHKKSFYHVGTMPTPKYLNSYVYDLRMMIIATEKGFRPTAMYSRQANQPLTQHLTEDDDSWAILGTNLSVRNDKGEFESETDRLLLVDRKDFNKLGLSVDDLIKAFTVTVFSIIAIDKMCCRLIEESTGELNTSILSQMNPDQALLEEIMIGNPKIPN
eukprot:Awhi_evm2s2358